MPRVDISLIGFIVFSIASAYILYFVYHWNQDGCLMATSKAETIYEFSVIDIDGNEVSLCSYCEGMVCLIVNVPSKCCMTDSKYQQLQQLHEKYSQQGLRILAFPCNQFNGQAPKPNSEMRKCGPRKNKFDFDLFTRIDVNGDDASALFTFLKNHKNTRGYFFNAINCDFTKFLVDRCGIPRYRYSPTVKANETAKYIEALLAEEP